MPGITDERIGQIIDRHMNNYGDEFYASSWERDNHIRGVFVSSTMSALIALVRECVRESESKPDAQSPERTVRSFCDRLEDMMSIGILLKYDELVKVLTAVQRVADETRMLKLESVSREYQILHDNIMSQAISPSYTRTTETE